MSTTFTLLTALEAGEILRLRTRQIIRLAKAGEIPHILLPGDEIRFSEPDLRLWVDERRRSRKVQADA